jgi:quinolinate synthase
MIEIFWRTTMGNRTRSVNPAPAKLVKKFERFIKIAKDILDGTISPAMDPRDNASLTDIQAYAPIMEYVNLTFPCWAHRRICVTSSGHVGMVPPYARVGDEVVVFPGMQTPLVIRAMPKRILRKYQIIGECYVHGLMNQEAFSLRNPRKIYEII